MGIPQDEVREDVVALLLVASIAQKIGTNKHRVRLPRADSRKRSRPWCSDALRRRRHTTASASAKTTQHSRRGEASNRPFAQLLPGLETGHPVTVGQSPTCSFSVSDGREVLFLSPFRAVLGAIHVQVTDRPSPDAPSLTQTNNCANGPFGNGAYNTS